MPRRSRHDTARCGTRTRCDTRARRPMRTLLTPVLLAASAAATAAQPTPVDPHVLWSHETGG
jgi:hypothetical protein